MASNNAVGTALRNLITWPAGHVGHLSEDQQVALVRFKELAQQKGYYVPASETKPATHDDETLLRYLRARKYVPQDALGQFRDTEEWRKENQLDSLYETIDLAEYEASRRLYPQWTGRRDKRGVPVYVYAVAQVDSKDVNAASNSKEAKKANAANPNKVPRHMLVLFALYENLCRFVLPLCSAMPDRTHTESPISQSMNIVDLSGVGISKFWALKNHLSDASKLATAHYPETLDRIFVVGAPSFFPTVWDWTKKWFDPITVAKFSILSQKNLREQLEEHIHIDNIPVKYGGKLEWNFGDMPYLDPNIVQSMTWNEDTTEKGHRTLPKGPIKWQYDQDGSMVATAIGTVTGRPRASVIAGLRLVPGVAQLALSPGRQDGNQFVSAMSQTQTPHPTDSGVSFAQQQRTGTSLEKFQQQKGTHAEGQLSEGTPQVKVDPQGTAQAITEPSTVGQAPKEHSEPGEAPSMMDQAKDMASKAANLPQTVMGAVGMGGNKAANEESEVQPKTDHVVDKMSNDNVEEFLRSQTTNNKI